MRVDKEKLDKLLSLPDEALWAEIVRLAGTYGFDLPKKTPTKEQLSKLRATANNDKIKAAEAMKLLNSIKRGGSNG